MACRVSQRSRGRDLNFLVCDVCGSGSGCRVERTGRRPGHSDGTRAGPGVRISLPFRNFPARRNAQCARGSLGVLRFSLFHHLIGFFLLVQCLLVPPAKNRPRRAAARRPVRSPEPAVLARADCGAVRCAGSSEKKIEREIYTAPYRVIPIPIRIVRCPRN